MKPLATRMVFAMAALALSSTPAQAFKIDPFTGRTFSDDAGFSEHVSSAVHEEQTEAALRLLGEASDAPHSRCVTSSIGPRRLEIRRRSMPLMRGLWWADDPNQLLPPNPVKWVAWMHDGLQISRTGTNWKGRPAKIGPNYYMNYRGHFGDMQFMHSMANVDGEAPQVTQRAILDWAEFLYAVATCRIKPDELISKHPIASVFPGKSGWSVQHLLDPSRLSRVTSIPEIAAGAMLHLVQDSFSAAHAKREAGATPTCGEGRISQFHAYPHQSVRRHATADDRSAWLQQARPETTAPVIASAKLLGFIRSDADWTGQVRPYLADKMFCVDPELSKASGPGDFDNAAR